MSVGTTPLIIHVPPSAPMRRRMMSALDTLDTFFVMAFSKLDHGTLRYAIPTSTQNADTMSRVICEAPSSESLPKARMVSVSIVTSTASGINAIITDGLFLRCCSCFVVFSLFIILEFL